MTSKRLSLLLCVAAATTLSGLPSVLTAAPAEPATVEVQGAEALPNAWFVQLKSAPAADATTAAATLRSEKNAFRSAAKNAGASFTERRSFEHAVERSVHHGVSRADIAKIRMLPGVTAVWPVAVIEAPPVEASPSPELFTALAMTGADVAQSELGYTGAGRQGRGDGHRHRL